MSASITVEFDLDMLTFQDQLVIHSVRAFSDNGDSGSLIVDRASGRATGLLIGGAPECTIANHIGDVLQALNVKLVY